ncbi:response regulator [Thalassotalea euphylliae]|uniref:Response regulator n=1 Tax=Thalassotalea euphylliae TaxID=1655234 RepID=A0A3E0U1Q0_9GAMM|nr:response regulator [Thalassotalea euphylliae]REL29962.1 response regulator [Thalassotalea euphylliae]
MNILVVDDNSAVLAQINCLLAGRGHHVANAKNGLDGYKKYQEQPFDLLIIDHLMPLMDGVKLLKNISQDEHLIPIIFMTTQGRESMKHLIEQSLCDCILDKPIDDVKFLTLIAQLNKQNTRVASL